MREARKTMALRSPNAAGYTPPTVPTSNPCLNCGTNVQLNYCPECGQRAIDPDPTLREFVQELAQEFINWDGKLFTTFRLLLARPGALTQEYLVGRRISFISPLRLYLTCSVLYFFAGAVLPEPTARIRAGAVAESKMGPLTVTASDRSSIERSLDHDARSGSLMTRSWLSHFRNALSHGDELTARLKEMLPRVMFVLVPLFAALVGLVFRRMRMRYPQHLAFALHVHAFMFVALILTLAPRVTARAMGHVSHQVATALNIGNAILVAISFAAIAWYLVEAIRRVYATSVRGAIARGAVVGGVYFFAYAVVLGVTFWLVVLLRF
jgi:hypothetical protein